MAQDTDEHALSEGAPRSARNADLSPAHPSASGNTDTFRAAPIRQRLTMVTAVWGDWHLNMHLNVNLPTLLAPRNLPTLSQHCDITYVIYTRAADFVRIDTAPEIAALRQLMSVEIKLLDQADLKDPIAAHHLAWNQAIKRAAADGSLVLLMPPDVAWAENSFASVAERLTRGERAIFMTYLRAESTTFVEALLERRPKDQIANTVPAQEMVELCVRSLHPLMAASLRDSDYFPIHPEMILWAVRGEGFAVRVLAREMFIFDPNYFHLNQAALSAEPVRPDEASFLSDSDELFAVSLATLDKDVAWYINPQEADSIDIAGWWLKYDSPVNDFIASQKIRWHFAPATEEKWQAKERASDLFVRRAAAAREGMRLWRSARQLDCSMVSLVLALATHTGPLVRAARGRGHAIVLLPNDSAFRRNGKAFLDRLLAPEGAKTLTRLLRAHHIPDAGVATDTTDPLAALLGQAEQRQVMSADGPLLLRSLPDDSIEIGQARVMDGPLQVGRLTVYVVDRVVRSSA